VKREIPWALVGYLLLCLVVFCVCWIGYADQMLAPKFTFPIQRATLKNPIWNFWNGSANFLLCNTGTIPTTVVSITVNGHEVEFYPSNVTLLEDEEITITIHYSFKPNHTYTFVLLDEMGSIYRPPDFIAK